ncbi:AAA family ATPase [Taibaiella koreensis]|uniref:AAA family ATPase n=1 Tax=Taibaiella koreensis TaxID=1268548 RepID=UPI000E59CF41|nr:MoxR family ATPase [Taibaiella koreensis]
MENNNEWHEGENSKPATGDALFQSRINIQPVQDITDRIKEASARIIVGQHETIELLLAALLADGHVLIEGVPGVAKTLMAKTLARLVDAGFSRIQFTPDLMPSDVVGTSVFNPQEARFTFKHGPVFSNVVLIDEINRAPAKTQAALFEVMEERQVTVDGTTYKMDPPFVVLATQNPVEHEGTYRLPEAQLDRFLFKINVGYPSIEEETRILTERHEQKGSTLLDTLQPVISRQQLAECRALVQQVHIETKLIEFMARLTVATRSDRSLYLGASPRASLALMNAAKAIAVLRGRDFVTPEDILYVAPSVLRHRIALTPEREMEGATPDDVLKELISRQEVPR